MSDHDNAAVFSDMDVADRCIATMQYDGALWTIGHCRGNGLIDWAQGIDLSVARGLCSALADALGVELHPAGTAAKLQELAKERDEAEVVRSDRRRLLAENAELRQEAAENAADKKESLKCIRRLSESVSRVRRDRIDYDRVRAEVPECEGLSDREINALLARIDFWGSMSTDQRNLISDRSSTLTAFDPCSQTYPMTSRGREVLATIDACRVTEEEPIGYSLRALLGLAWEYVHDARAGSSFLDAARAEGLLVGTYGERKPTDLGRKTWTDFLRRLGLPGDGSKPEPEPEPTLTESADGRRDWWLNGKRHRDDGPAIELPDGRREWWLHGKRHREDGPAIEWPDGYRSWWLNGVRQPEPDKGGRQ